MQQPPLDGVQHSSWTNTLLEGVREEWAWVASGLMGVGAVLVCLATVGVLPARGLSAFVGSFLLIYAVLIVLQRRTFSGIVGTAGQRMRAAIISKGVGFYGVMTMARFLQLELHDLVDGLGEFAVTREQVFGMAKDWLIGFSAQSLRNSIDAFLWPMKLMGDYGMFRAGVMGGSAWVLYALGAKVFPDVHAGIEAAQAEAKEKSKAKRKAKANGAEQKVS